MADQEEMREEFEAAEAQKAEDIPQDVTEEAAEETAQEAKASAGEEASSQEEAKAAAEEEAKPQGAAAEKIAALEDRVKRQMAEFDNFRKRTEREKEQRFSMGERNVIEKILPVVDNFERGLQAVPDSEKSGALASGMEMIYKQLMKQLEDLGVKPIEALGKEFDPNFHNAVMQVASEEYESGIVAQEFQKGYLYHDSVLRHSMVGVAE